MLRGKATLKAQTQLCRPSGYGDFLWAGRPTLRIVFRPLALFLVRKWKIYHDQNVKEFQFYIRMPNFTFIASIIIKKSTGKHVKLKFLGR